MIVYIKHSLSHFQVTKYIYKLILCFPFIYISEIHLTQFISLVHATCKAAKLTECGHTALVLAILLAARSSMSQWQMQGHRGQLLHLLCCASDPMHPGVPQMQQSYCQGLFWFLMRTVDPSSTVTLGCRPHLEGRPRTGSVLLYEGTGACRPTTHRRR